jgi:hypothetical protein
MHLTLKKETTRPAGANSLQQQVRFDEFVKEFNEERPHQALEMKTPGQVYQPSNRAYNGLPDITYPFHDKEAMITNCGRLRLHRKKINISTALPGQKIGIKEVVDQIWMIPFLDYDP